MTADRVGNCYVYSPFFHIRLLLINGILGYFMKQVLNESVVERFIITQMSIIISMDNGESGIQLSSYK